VLGFLSLWSVGLTSISMVCVVMAIGLSVDYTAHIALHLYHELQGVLRRSFITLPNRHHTVAH
jgi:predicted RND superfamily exporter protein